MPIAVAGDALFYCSMQSRPDPDAAEKRRIAQDFAARGGSISFDDAGWDYPVHRAALDGTGDVTLAIADSPGELACDGERVYWTEPYRDRVLAVPRDGGEPSVILDGISFPHAILADADAIYVGALKHAGLVRIDRATWQHAFVSRSPAGALVADATAIYWASDDEVWRAAKAGGEPALVTRARSSVGALALGGGFLYLLAGSTVARVRSDGGVPEVVATDAAPSSRALAADATGVYWSLDRAGLRWRGHAGDERAFATPPREPRFVVATPHGLYTTGSDGAYVVTA